VAKATKDENMFCLRLLINFVLIITLVSLVAFIMAGICYLLIWLLMQDKLLAGFTFHYVFYFGCLIVILLGTATDVFPFDLDEIYRRLKAISHQKMND
jgi:hypothetical protein